MELTSRFEPMPGELMVPPEVVVPDELPELPLDELLVPLVPVSELSNDDRLLVLDEVALVMDSTLRVPERSPSYGGGLRAPGKALVQ
jgi:hypothetical protein